MNTNAPKTTEVEKEDQAEETLKTPLYFSPGKNGRGGKRAENMRFPSPVELEKMNPTAYARAVRRGIAVFLQNEFTRAFATDGDDPIEIREKTLEGFKNWVAPERTGATKYKNEALRNGARLIVVLVENGTPFDEAKKMAGTACAFLTSLDEAKQTLATIDA